jgi:hypothetical protein
VPAPMNLFKKFEKKFKKCDSSQKLKRLLNDLEIQEAWLKIKLDESTDDETFESLRKEYKATLKLIHKCQSKIEKER